MGCGSSNTAETNTSNTADTRQATTNENSNNTSQQKTTTNNQTNRNDNTQPKSETNKSSSSDPKSSFIEDAIQAHNEFRDKHGTPHVVHAQDLSDYAQKWAEHLVKTGKFEHSDCKHKSGSIGENLAMMGGSNLSTKKASDYVKMWYDEIKDYTYFGNDPDMNQFGKYGHFTQVVWKGTKEVGIGIASANNQCVVVGSYRPAGNMMGDFAENVPPPF